MIIAAIPSPTESVWHVLGFPIRAYALCIILGMVAATLILEQRLRHRGAAPWVSLDIVVWAVPFGIIGARIYHVITSPQDYFGEGGSPVKAFFIWEGGLGIWGAVAGGAVGALIAARQIGIPLSVVADSLAPGLPVAQAIGRLGNWFNNELYGGVTTVPWGLEVHEMDPSNPGHAVMIDGEPVTRPDLYHPTFLYELVWNLGVALFVWLLDRKFKFGRGRAFALYVMAYTVGRFWIEILREDTATHFFGIRLNVYTSILVFLGAAIYFFMVKGPRGYVVPIDGPDTVAEPAAADADSDVSQVDVTAAGKTAERKPPVAYRLVTEEQFVEYQKSGALPEEEKAAEPEPEPAPVSAGSAGDGEADDSADKPADKD
ncbi:prolipoprotein diacylglyceryl transferase [Actinoplanes philippinensis]|uniref:Phosphatidylglycerol--prolipoprotein diacylglyceryl transferase n=1 Tax=Actinoplanes philippinensis TaxID=35752 RepID=A0A1I2BIZ2_9ACTN|nr:prolipoprotein diacylglyceryl transferase [Actinoplanes philippinensis]GIE75927.1 prolipoprotein diacylglyceryl transferase [Actinoplanes philippinensis]SFE55897.1 prolipoprotein diacylglyceryl transferase [Actinoplanes philippinensis]